MFFEDQRNKLKNGLGLAGFVLAAFLMAWLALNAAYQQYAFEQRCVVEKQLQRQSLKIVSVIEQARTATRAIALVLEHHMNAPLDDKNEKDLKTITDKAMEAFPYISGVQITRNGAVILETRIRSEIDSLRGVDLFVNETFKEATIRSVNQITSSIIGPVELTSNALGLYVQTPVFSRENEFLGLVQIAMRVDKLLFAADIDQLARAGMPYELWKISEAQNSRWLFFYESETLLSKNLLSSPIDLQGNHWELVVEDTTEKNESSIQAASFLIALLSSIAAGLLAVRMMDIKKQQLIATEKKDARLIRFINYVDHYQEILDAADVGFILWDKHQNLELWNLGFEKMYPKLVPFLEKGMFRKEVQALRAKFDERDIITDWESTGTWYRHLNDGRIIMLKRFAMPDGGRLGMHVDMTASLGDQEHETA